MTSAEDINRVFNGIQDPEEETVDEDYEEDHERPTRIIKSSLRLPETQRGESRANTLSTYSPRLELCLPVCTPHTD